MNPLSSSNSSKWIADGSSEGTLTVDGSTISLASSKRGTPFNIRLDDANLTSSSSFFYEIEIMKLTGNLAVGIVTKDEFLPGWKTKGMFYNGNLTNGSAGLKIGFGNHPGVGDKVGIYVQRRSGTTELKTIIYLNGRCLGPGFQLDNAATTEVFYPCLHLDGSGVVKYVAPPTLPTNTDREPTQRPDAYSGDWKLKQAFAGPELGEFPLPKDAAIILRFHPEQDDASSYRLSIKVGNTMNTRVKITGKMEAFDKIEVGMVMSTMMMPPPELAAVETYLSSSLPELYKMIVSSDASSSGDLVMTGPTAELICQQYEKVFEPVTSYK